MQIDDAVCFPQAVVATMTEYNRVRQYRHSVVIDWGGYTADYVRSQDGKPDFSVCDSVIH